MFCLSTLTESTGKSSYESVAFLIPQPVVQFPPTLDTPTSPAATQPKFYPTSLHLLYVEFTVRFTNIISISQLQSCSSFARWFRTVSR